MTDVRFRRLDPFGRPVSRSILLFLFCCMAGVAEEKKTVEKNPTLTKVGDPVPAFEVKTLDGKVFNIRNLKGHVFFLNFFATWCPPCIAEMPRLEKEVWQKYKTGKFAFLSVGREETEE